MRTEVEHRSAKYMLNTQTLLNGVQMKIVPDLKNRDVQKSFDT
jgi:hypothetical protein